MPSICHSSKLSHKLRARGKGRNHTPVTVSLTQQESDALDAANAKANEIFAQNQLGRDSQDPVFYSESLLWEDYPEQINLRVAAGNSIPKHYEIVITRSVIAVMEQMNYRGVKTGINLIELIAKSDNAASGNCCSGFTNPEITTIPALGGKNRKAHCIFVSGTYSRWRLCADNPMQIYNFRMKLLIAVIKSFLRQQGIYNVNVLLPSDGFNDWTWRDQTTWPGICQSGAAQSPIDIDTGRAEEISFMNLRFVFKAARDAVLKFDGHENEIYGDFGKFIHKLEVGNRNCLTYKMKFKFPAEHAYLGAQADGEMQVFCMTSTGDYGVVSFFLRQDFDMKAFPNKFIKTLHLEKWNFDEDATAAGGTPLGIGGTDMKAQGNTQMAGSANLFSEDGPNLNLLITNTNDKNVLFSFKDIFRRSFAWYTGSMSTPPCKEGVQHYVFEQSIFMSEADFFSLREKSYPNDIEPEGNSRKPRPQGTRKIFTHSDYGTKCAEEPVPPFVDEPIDPAKKNKIYVPKLDLSHIKTHFLKASNIITTYGYTGMDLPQPLEALKEGNDAGRQTISIEPITSEEVPFDIRKKLIKKSQEVIKGINDKDDAILKKLEENESIKVPYFDD